MNNLDDSNVDDAIDKNEMMAIVYTANWCSPSLTMLPILEEAAQEINRPCYQVDIDSAIQNIEKVEIRGVPTIIVYKHGQEYKRTVGLLNKGDLLKMFE